MVQGACRVHAVVRRLGRFGATQNMLADHGDSFRNHSITESTYINMLTPDSDGRFWNAGLKIGIVYGVIAGILYAALDYALHNADAPERWLPLIAGFLMLTPVAASSHAYSVGQRSKTKTERRNKTE